MNRSREEMPLETDQKEENPWDQARRLQREEFEQKSGTRKETIEEYFGRVKRYGKYKPISEVPAGEVASARELGGQRRVVANKK